MDSTTTIVGGQVGPLEEPQKASDEKVLWAQCVPFILIHLAPFAAFITGVTPAAVVLCLVLHCVKMFFITAGYHRYFSHRAFKTSRFMQFVMAFGGGMAAQKGALWWAAHHRQHHAHTDQDGDVHSPKMGFWWSHVGWILCSKYLATDYDAIKDFARYPELRFLNKHHWIPPACLALFCYAVAGWSGLVIGFFASTVLSYHATFCINSVTHIFGQRRYATADTSRNSLLFALVCFGEGWHNNHHHYQASARMGFFWWEIDLSFYVLKLLEALGLVWDLRKVPQSAREAKLIKRGFIDVGMLPDGEPSIG
jgi:stearoyl-CoA desaturase (delta-9 desaturase)